MTETKLIEDVKDYWSYGFHDNEYGTVTNICLSYNEKFLFSVGADSNIFGILFNCDEVELERAKLEKIKVQASSAEVKAVNDIEDPAFYSIEQAKQKSENEKIISIAERKKAEMREKITNLRKSFKDLTKKNDQLVPRLKLNKDEFLIEESIKDQVLSQIKEKIDLTYKELAWQSEKCRLLLDKLQSRFKDVVSNEHIIVFAFDELGEGTLTVDSFRTIALPRDMEEYKDQLQQQYLTKIIDNDNNNINQTTLQDINSINSINSGEDIKMKGISTSEQMSKLLAKLKGNTRMRIERALKKMDEKKLKRLKRREEWNALIASRLPDEYEDPNDLANIKYAQENLGNFKLKSSDDYVIPDNQRMNVFKAVDRLMQIKRFIFVNQMAFNRQVLKLRDYKAELVKNINKKIDRVEQIQYILGYESLERIQRPRLRIEETPEKKYECTKERLIEFKKELESKAKSNADNDANGGGDNSGFGGFSSNTQKKEIQLEESNTMDLVINSQVNTENIRPLWSFRDTFTGALVTINEAKQIK
jgi:cilia- and flagella-associated protein 44